MESRSPGFYLRMDKIKHEMNQWPLDLYKELSFFLSELFTHCDKEIHVNISDLNRAYAPMKS